TDLHTRLLVDADEEATFSIDEPDDPVGVQSFLLVVCTGWIFTLVEYHRILQMFQHIARCASCHCWQAGLAMNLRTVLAVTAHQMVRTRSILSCSACRHAGRTVSSHC